MAEIIKMPKLSDTMTEGVVAKWHKKVGDNIQVGDIIADIETDKATMEFESFFNGTLLYIGVEEGKTAVVDAILAIVGNANEDYKALLDNVATAKPTEVKQKTDTLPTVQLVEAQKNNSTDISNDKKLKASPLAKKIAKDKGINLLFIQGTGDNGRIVKRDIENISTSHTTNVQPTYQEESYTEVAVSQMRKTIAKRLSESKFTAPHFYLTIEVNMDNLVEARKSINALHNAKISFNDIVVKATAIALRKHKKINASWLGDTIRYNNHINIGVAMAVEDGLLVPVVKQTDKKNLLEISQEIKNFAQKAKDKKLQPEDWTGNTFTISNLGMFGIEEFTAIINPPDACILAVGAIVQKPIVKNGTIMIGNMMKMTLSCDHRVVDGATGAEFLATLKQLLENPVAML